MQNDSETPQATSYCDDVVLQFQRSEVQGSVSLILDGYFKVDAQ